MRPGNLTIILLVLFPIATSRALETAPSPDFSAGFTQLAALGLPGLDGQAKWCVHPEAGSINYEMREVAKSIKGNAWLLPSADGKIRFVPIGGVEIIELDPSKKGGAGGGSAKKAEPTILQDPSKDVEAIISGLNKLAAKRDPDDRFSYSSRSSNFGGLLLLAAQLHQTGHTELANKLAVAVFGVYPSREAAVDSAIDKLADHFYQQATQAFFKSGDWAAYQQALAALVKRFPRGWTSKDAVAIFLPQLEKQAAGAKAPDPSLPNIVIDPRALEIIRELCEKPPADPKEVDAPDADSVPPGMRHRMRMSGYMGEYGGDEYSPSSLWLIGESPDPKETKSPLARLAALKMAAFPALAALAADPFLTHIPNPGSYSGYYSSDESSDERTLRAYSSLNRPSTRGEIARKLLTATLPDPQNELDDADPDTVRELALEFWKQHKTATREELAAVFLREGSRSQSSQAATILASSSDPNAHKIFEAHILASEQAIAYFQDVQTYLKTRKAAAKPFLDSYAKLVRSQTDGVSEDQENNEYSWQVKQAGGVAKILKQLESLVGGQSPRALAVQIAKGKPEDAEAAIRSLTALLEGSTPTKHLFALLEGANAATDATTRTRFLIAINQIAWGPARDEEEDEDKIVRAKPIDRSISEPEAAVWRKLITDTRECKLPRAGENATVAECAAMALEDSLFSGNMFSANAPSSAINRAALILNKPAETLFLERATARLSGKPIPTLPDASRVSEERLAAIIAEAGKKQPTEIHPYLRTLTQDERAAWLEWIRDQIRDQGGAECPDSIRELHYTVIERQSTKTGKNPANPPPEIIAPGFRITPDAFHKLIESLAPEIAKASRTITTLSTFSTFNFGPGLTAHSISVPLPTIREQDEKDREERVLGYPRFQGVRIMDEHEIATAVVQLDLETNDDFSQSIWLIENGKAILQATSGEAGDDLATVLKNMLESKRLEQCRIKIDILTRADLTKFKSSTEEE